MLKQPHKIRIDFEELEYVSETSEEILGYHGERFTGYAVLDYFPDGSVSYEKEYRNGEVMGWINEYAERGQLISEKLCIWDSGNPLLLNKYDLTGNLIRSSLVVSPEKYREYVDRFNLLA